MKRILSLLITMMFSSSTIAQIADTDIAKCAAVKGDLERLSCYDEIAKINNLTSPQTQTTNEPSNSKWVVTSNTNPVDDTKTAVAMLVADAGASKWGNQITFIARCKSGSTEVFINWYDYLGSEATVLTRVGNEKAKTSEWDLSSDSKASFAPQPVKLLKAMQTSNKFLAQITPYNESPVTAIFDTTGFDNAIKPLRELCKW
jgi:type VI secretion system protein VasI